MTFSLRAALLATIAATAALPAAAQVPGPGTAAASTAAPAATGEADTIIVTGTRRTDRTVADSPVPIDVIGAESLRSSGFTETNRLLNQLVPSFNFPQPSITDGTDVIRPATLRGLSPDQTLVLVNGKRRATTALLNINNSVGRGSAAVDINLIPSAAIERVEVLRDGAAAQYGSDAIAGVINFQLRRAREGGSVTVTYGQYDTTLSGVREFTGLQRDAANNPVLLPNSVLTGALTDQVAIFAFNQGRELKRRDGRTITVAGNIGLPLGPEGFLNVSAEYRDRDPTNRAGLDPRRYYGLPNAPIDPRDLTVNRLTHRYGDAGTGDVLAFVNAGLPLGDNLELYAFGSFGDRNGESAVFFRRPNDSRTPTVLYPDGLLPFITTKLRDYQGAVGIRGEVGGFKADLSAGYARNQFDFLIANTANTSLGAASPTTIDSGGLRYDQFIANLDLSRDLTVGLFDSVTVAAGAEYRREGYQLRPGSPDSYRQGPALLGQVNSFFAGTAAANLPTASGAQGFGGIQPTIGGQDVTRRRTRDAISAYTELDVDIVKGWNVQLAGRFERYSDFGSTVNGKVATSVDVYEGIRLRGSLSTGFRAPSLQQQFFASQATNNIGGVLLDTVTLPVDNPVAIALGSRPLEPEKSTNYSLGVVLNPTDRLNITVDYYSIAIRDRIVVTENLTAARNPDGSPSTTNAVGGAIARILNNAGFNNINAARFFVNGVRTTTSGFDAVGTYRLPVGADGELRLTAGFNYNKTTIDSISTVPGALSQVPGIVLFGRFQSLVFEQGQPRTKLNLAADYTQGIFGLTLRTNRFGRVLSPGTQVPTGPLATFPGQQIVGGQPNRQFWGDDFYLTPKWITDLEVRIEPIKGLEFAIGANNLFDVYPDRLPTGPRPAEVGGGFYGINNYFIPYSNFTPFGFNGRFLYARAGFRF